MKSINSNEAQGGYFSQELSEYYNSGAFPKHGGQDIKYCLEQQKKRLDKFGLQKHLQLQLPKNEKHRYKTRHDEADKMFQSKKYICSIDSEKYERRIRFTSGNKTLYYEKTFTMLSLSTIDFKNPVDISQDNYCCSSCGAISTIQELSENGCKYCGSSYHMNDLFPKVTGYLYRDIPSPKIVINDKGKFAVKDEQKRRNDTLSKIGAAIFIFAFIIFFVLGCLFVMQHLDTAAYREAEISAKFLLSVAVSGVCSYFISILIYIAFTMISSFASMIYIAGLQHMANKLNRKLNKSRKKASATENMYSDEDEIKMILHGDDENFSYDFFESKVAAILESIIYTDDRENQSPFFESKDKDHNYKLDNIIDITFDGTLGIEGSKISEADTRVLNLVVGVHQLCYNNGKIKPENTKYRMVLEKSLNAKETPDFSVHRYECRMCGGSFNAAKLNKCPYCGKNYRLMDSDWVCTHLLPYIKPNGKNFHIYPQDIPFSRVKTAAEKFLEFLKKAFWFLFKLAVVALILLIIYKYYTANKF